jgi:membrane-associated protein
MQLLSRLLEFFLHLDRYLDQIIQTFGGWTYAILFLVLFCETGLVVTPFLPGDSLLFAVGTFAALGHLDIGIVLPLLFVAAVVGDNANYWIGRKVGPRIFHRTDVRFLNRRHLERTHAFYEKHGVKTIIIARFIPIIRTFTPFVAGIGAMTYRRFLPYDILGGALWVGIFVLGGYFFGTLEVVRRHFSIVIVAIILISLLPGLVEVLRHRLNARKAGRGPRV